MNDHDVYYIAAETTVRGEQRGFSRQIRARTRPCETMPGIVQHAGEQFLADVLAGSDVHCYEACRRGEAFDHPYRYASYYVERNGERIVTSMAVLPVRPEVK